MHYEECMVATRAGLGWIGKTDLFISKKIGPRLRADARVCGMCVAVCPVGQKNK